MSVLVSSPVAKSAYKQHRYRNKCIAMGSIYAWVFSVDGVSAPLTHISLHYCQKISSYPLED